MTTFNSLFEYLINIPGLTFEIGIGDTLIIPEFPAADTSQIIATRIADSVDVSPTVTVSNNVLTVSSSFSPASDLTDITYFYLGYRNGSSLQSVLVLEPVDIPSLLSTETLDFEVSVTLNV